MKLSFLFLILTVLNVFVLGQDKAKYKIGKEYCKDNKCIVWAYVGSESYNESNMQMLAEELAIKYKDKDVVNFRVFDNQEIIQAYKEGKREPSNILSDSRAYFIHNSGCGDILFYKSEKDKIKLVKISWKNTKSCNTPFTVF
ncbi:MAG TPA: hypothetical protein VEX17_03385 [Bacillales bacterium]|nr:hypothetical protein [Bacillales bacterium]